MICEGGNFCDADAEYCDFTRSDLQGACFDGAEVSRAVFKNADLRRATFEGAELPSVEKFEGAIVEEGAEWIDGVGGAIRDIIVAAVGGAMGTKIDRSIRQNQQSNETDETNQDSSKRADSDEDGESASTNEFEFGEHR